MTNTDSADLALLLHTYQKADAYRHPLLHLLGGAMPVHGDGIHPNSVMDKLGNLAALVYRGTDGCVIGHDWIAPSFTMRDTVESGLSATGDICLQLDRKPGTRGALNMIWTQTDTKPSPLPARFRLAWRFRAPLGEPGFFPCQGRDHDSEFLLLSTLDKFLDRTARGTLYLLTERIPCCSCTAVIVEFAKKYPGIALQLAYLYEDPFDIRTYRFGRVKVLPPRTHADFFREVGRTPNIRLMKAYVRSATLHVVETLSGTEKHFADEDLHIGKRSDHALFTVALSKDAGTGASPANMSA